MINLIIDWRPIEVEFMGETVTAEVRPLTPAQMLAVVPHLGGVDSGDFVAASQKALMLQQAAAPILPEVVRNLKGVQVNGVDVDYVMLGAEAALCGLAVQLISQAIIITNLDKESEKNLPLPPAGISPGQIADQ